VKKNFKRKSFPAAPEEEQGVAGLISKMREQLSAVEKKLDILIGQSSKRPFEKSYSQSPSRGFNPSHRHERGRPDSDPRERTYTKVICADCNKECEIPFKPSGDRPVYCKECFAVRKRGNPFNASRDNRPEKRDFSRTRHSDTRAHHSDKRQDGKRQGGLKKKPFFHQRKKRA